MYNNVEFDYHHYRTEEVSRQVRKQNRYSRETESKRWKT